MTTDTHGAVISLMLGVPEAPTAVDWYKRALGATEPWNLGTVVGLEVEGAPFFLAQLANNGWDSPSDIGSTTVRVEVFVEDPDAFVERAIDAGAIAIRDYRLPGRKHRQGGFYDPFGHLWLVGDRSPLRRFPG
jgi:PhnB protein